ncbi:hypothetical protein [Streptomyces sp. NPDC059176]|uniref:hypothetical protein n=1 Tax=unclassified Streptomyces TaxID=2593676 RepID=UPI0036B00380
MSPVSSRSSTFSSIPCSTSLAAVRDLNRLELAGETLRAALEALACVAPDWLAGAVPVREWAERYGPRTHSWHPPASTRKREEMALVYDRDGFALLEAVHAPDAPAWLRELPAVQVLRTMWVQNYHRTVTEAGKTHLEHVFSAVALNVIRLDTWWNGHPLDRARFSHLARRGLSLAA